MPFPDSCPPVTRAEDCVNVQIRFKELKDAIFPASKGGRLNVQIQMKGQPSLKWSKVRCLNI